MSGTLFVVATPIGNLDDLSRRALDVLRDAHIIAAEDTRRTGRLLSHFGIQTPTFALHDHNERDASERVLKHLLEGNDVALVSDAGTPLVSDPGYRVVNAAMLQGVPVVPVPGCSALTAALSVSGLPTDRFCFEGFLPPKPTARRERLEQLARETRTLVFFEAVHRMAEVVADMADTFGPERPAFLAREISKRHEQYESGELGGLAGDLAAGRIPLKGEFVLVVGGAPAAAVEEVAFESLLVALLEELPASKAVAVTARVSGAAKNRVYAHMLDLKDRR